MPVTAPTLFRRVHGPFSRVVIPATRGLSLTGQVPFALNPQYRLPGNAGLLITTQAPTFVIAAQNVVRSPPTAIVNLALAGQAPTFVVSSPSSLNHGASFTVTGTNLGTKSTAAPVIWDNCQGTSITTLWSGGLPNSAANSTHNLAYSTAVNGVSTLHTRNGSKYMRAYHAQQGFYTGGNVMPYHNFTRPAFPFTRYYSWYTRLDPTWSNLGGDGNLKMWDYSSAVDNGGEPYDLPKNWYFEYNPTGYTAGGAIDTIGVAQWHANDDYIDGSGNGINLEGFGSWWGSNALYPRDNGKLAWIRVDAEIKYSSSVGGGYIKVWENGVSVVNLTMRNDGMAGTARCESIGGYVRATGGTTTQWRFFQDLYVDSTPARVIFGNASTLAASTTLANQIPTSWSATSIGITVNLGMFANGATAFAHVVDSGGTVHNNVMGSLTLGS